MTLEQHIEELRAELRNCCDRTERRQISEELEATLDELRTQRAAIELSEEPPS